MINNRYGYFYTSDDGNDKMDICPLTGGIKPPENECIYYDCKNVNPEKLSFLYGYKYRCKLEKKQIERWHEKLVKAEETYRKLNDSLEQSRSINIDKFYAYCNELDKKMIENRQVYSFDMLLCPYHDPNDRFLVYLFEDDEVTEISVTDNIMAYMGKRYTWLKNDKVKCEMSCSTIPALLSEAINVRMHLNHKMDVKAILHIDNPVYIKDSGLNKYIDAAYGLTWHEFKKIKDKHLEITEIVNYDKIIYVKQELDVIIRREKNKL